jgi:beta-glucanase (GH16 family)
MENLKVKKITDTDYLCPILNTRYNGGWVKSITGINKAKSNGYSLQGDFLSNGNKSSSEVRVTEGKLYLDCGIGGSRKSQEKKYTFFTIRNSEIVIVHEEKDSSSWAINSWEAIEKFLAGSSKEIIPEPTNPKLSDFSTADLIAELQARQKNENLGAFRIIEMDEVK